MLENELRIDKSDGMKITFDELVDQTTRRIDTVPYFIGIAGNSGSGKSAIAKELVSALSSVHTVGTLDMDIYLDDIDKQKHSSEPMVFFCGYDPAVFNLDVVAEDLSTLKNGDPVYIPDYDRSIHKKMGNQLIHPQDVIIVEGMRALDDEVAPLLNEKILIEADLKIRLIRRLIRNVLFLHRTDYDDMIERYLEISEPGYVYYLDWLRKKADFIIDNTGEKGKTTMELTSNLVKLKLDDLKAEFRITDNTRERLKRFFG